MSLDIEQTNKYLTKLYQNGIMFEQTAYDLGRVPDEMMVRVLEQDITTTPLPYAGEILNFIDSRIRRKKHLNIMRKLIMKRLLKSEAFLLRI